MMRAHRYFSHFMHVLRKTNSTMPWERYKLRKMGSKFALNYSEEGNAKLTIWTRPLDKVGVGVGERQYEYAFTIEKFREHNIHNKDVLDVGSTGSVLPPILAALGNHVVCVDVREWLIMWPNLEFVRCDLLASDIPFETFDVITCVSTAEHFGLGRYGDKQDVNGDIKGITILRKYLKPKGLMILTVPFGRATVAFPACGIYDKSRFSRLIIGFGILEKKFFGPIDKPNVYRPCTEEETYLVNTDRNYAIICSLLEKQ